MLIKNVKRNSGLSVEEVKQFFGVQSTYKRQKKATLVVGESKQGTIVQGTMIISEQGEDLALYAIQAFESGAGSMIMRKICGFADKHGLIIEDLHPSPYNVYYNPNKVKKKNKTELIDFYKSFGFEFVKNKKKMFRNPMQVDRNP
jgi:hypothetical protein